MQTHIWNKYISILTQTLSDTAREVQTYRNSIYLPPGSFNPQDCVVNWFLCVLSSCLLLFSFSHVAFLCPSPSQKHYLLLFPTVVGSLNADWNILKTLTGRMWTLKKQFQLLIFVDFSPVVSLSGTLGNIEQTWIMIRIWYLDLVPTNPLHRRHSLPHDPQQDLMSTQARFIFFVLF